MKKITHAELIEKIVATKGMAIVGMQTLTDAGLLKTGNPFAMPVMKQSRLVAHVGADYELGVNNEALRQDGTPAFESGSLPKGRAWHTYKKILVSIKDPTKFYLRTQSTPGKRDRQPNKILCFRDANGKFLSREEIKPFMPVRKESTKQQNSTGIKRTVHINDYLFSSIQKIRIGGETFQVE